MARRRAGTTAGLGGGATDGENGRVEGEATDEENGRVEGGANDGENGRVEDGAEARYAPSGGRLPTNCDASGAAAGDPY